MGSKDSDMTNISEAPAIKMLTASLSGQETHRKANDRIDIEGRRHEKLKVSFQRTVRVPDNQEDNQLPPGMGTFPLYSVSHYQDKLPEDVSAKGGLFLPMYRELKSRDSNSVGSGHRANESQNARRCGSTFGPTHLLRSKSSLEVSMLFPASH